MNSRLVDDLVGYNDRMIKGFFLHSGRQSICRLNAQKLILNCSNWTRL